MMSTVRYHVPFICFRDPDVSPSMTNFMIYYTMPRFSMALKYDMTPRSLTSMLRFERWFSRTARGWVETRLSVPMGNLEYQGEYSSASHNQAG